MTLPRQRPRSLGNMFVHLILTPNATTELMLQIKMIVQTFKTKSVRMVVDATKQPTDCDYSSVQVLKPYTPDARAHKSIS